MKIFKKKNQRISDASEAHHFPLTIEFIMIMHKASQLAEKISLNMSSVSMKTKSSDDSARNSELSADSPAGFVEDSSKTGIRTMKQHDEMYMEIRRCMC